MIRDEFRKWPLKLEEDKITQSKGVLIGTIVSSVLWTLIILFMLHI